MTFQAFEEIAAQGKSRWCISCDHASNQVPDDVAGGDLGLPEREMSRHIAFDPGAAGVARALSEHLSGPAVLSRFSRLVIDPNRGEHDPTLIRQVYDGTIVPANRNLTLDEREHRLNLCYRPYDDALKRMVQGVERPILVSVHSFTPRFEGRDGRPWEVSVLHARTHTTLARAVLDRLRAEADLTVGDNEPYGGHLPGDAVDRHALRHGHPNVLIELRQDKIETEAQQRAWAARLAPILDAALRDAQV